jgi:hypothetical protein
MIEVPDDSEVRNGFRLVKRIGAWSHWAADRYLTPVGASQPSLRPPPPRPQAGESYGPRLAQDVHIAFHALQSYIRWRNPPAAEPGMGGVIPGFDNGLGRVQFPYLNWINGYRDASIALTRGVTAADIRDWAVRSESIRPGTQNGMLKALQIWQAQAPPDVKRLVSANLSPETHEYELKIKLQVDVELTLNRFLEAEVRRLGTNGLGEATHWRAPRGFINPR